MSLIINLMWESIRKGESRYYVYPNSWGFEDPLKKQKYLPIRGRDFDKEEEGNRKT